ncbi:hypothetical protein [Rhodococcus sovatensis]|uniref:Uncharacterized protein n=1 Tax=Rhodococcus sovatensis TaxID=1805840 RepID=A0ABZ2PMW3_9NOCA
MMSDAVRAALPADVAVALAPPSSSLVFQPVEDFGDTVPQGVIPTTSASGQLVRDGVSAYTTIGVGPADAGVPDCVAGDLDSRTTMPDRTVVDTLDTWYEESGSRTYWRSATAYHPDGTRVHVSLTGNDLTALPLGADEAAAIAGSPDLALSTLAPAGTPAPRQDCSVYAASSTGTVQDIRRESVDAANAALTATWASIPNAPTLDRPIGSLVPDGFTSGVCTDLDVVGARIGLSVSVSGGQPLPAPVDPYDPNAAYGPLPVTRTLPDGSVMQSEDAGITEGLVSEDGTTRLSRSVTLMGLDRRVFDSSEVSRRKLITEPLVGDHYMAPERRSTPKVRSWPHRPARVPRTLMGCRASRALIH